MHGVAICGVGQRARKAPCAPAYLFERALRAFSGAFEIRRPANLPRLERKKLGHGAEPIRYARQTSDEEPNIREDVLSFFEAQPGPGLNVSMMCAKTCLRREAQASSPVSTLASRHFVLRNCD